MGLFKSNFSKPGPGVPKNAPRKTGFARFFEIFGRDFSNLVKLNLLFQLCVLPAEALLLVSVVSLLAGLGGGMLLFGLLALVACIPLGPATTALYYVVSKMMRDDPGFVWQDFKRIFKENFRSTLVPGLLYGLITGAQVFGVVYFILARGNVPVVATALFLFSSLAVAMAVPYFFLQSAYVDLKTLPKLNNSVLLAFGRAPRSLMGALLGTGLVALQAYFFPIPFVVTIFFGYAIPNLLAQMWVWPVMDKMFGIEKTLRERQAAEVDEAMQTPPGGAAS